MGLGGHAGVQRHFDGAQDCLFFVLENQSEDLRHFSVAAGSLKKILLQPLEAVRQFGEGRSVA